MPPPDTVISMQENHMMVPWTYKDNEGAGPDEAAGEEHSEDQSDEATDHQSRPSIFKARRNISGGELTMSSSWYS